LIKSFSSQARPSKEHTASLRREASAKVTAALAKREPWMKQVDVTLDTLSNSFRANKQFSRTAIEKSVRGLRTVASQVEGQIASAEEHFATAIRLGCPQETVAAVMKQAEDLGMLRSKVAILLRVAQTSLAADDDGSDGTVRLDETGYMVPPDDNPIDSLPEGGGVGDDTKSFADPDFPETPFDMNGGGHRPPAKPAEMTSADHDTPPVDSDGDGIPDDLNQMGQDPAAAPSVPPTSSAAASKKKAAMALPTTPAGMRALAMRLLTAADSADADINRSESDKKPVGTPNEQPSTPEQSNEPWEPSKINEVSTSPKYQGEESDSSPVGTPPKKPDYDKNPDGYSQEDPSAKPPTSNVQAKTKKKADASDFGDDGDPPEEPAPVTTTVGKKTAAEDDSDDDGDKDDDSLELPPGMDDSSVANFFASEFDGDDDNQDADDDSTSPDDGDSATAVRQARRATASRQPGNRGRDEQDLLQQSINDDIFN
jgi:hypothetical protein